MDDINIQRFISFTENTNSIFSNIVRIINSQQGTYNTILNNNYNRNLYREGYTRNNNIDPNLSQNILQQSILRNLFFRNVSIVNNENNLETNIPTEEQIAITTTRTIFQEINNPINSTCPISQTDFSNNDNVIQINNCRHIFSERPLLQWFTRNHCCPMCRYSIIYNTSNPTNDQDNINNIRRNNEANINGTSNISNEMLNQLQNIIDTLNDNSGYEFALITPSQ